MGLGYLLERPSLAGHMAYSPSCHRPGTLRTLGPTLGFYLNCYCILRKPYLETCLWLWYHFTIVTNLLNSFYTISASVHRIFPPPAHWLFPHELRCYSPSSSSLLHDSIATGEGRGRLLSGSELLIPFHISENCLPKMPA